MASYYGLNDQGKMAHIRLRESMEEWHIRCAESRELYRQLRADVGTEYSRKDNHRQIKELRAAVEQLQLDQQNALVASNLLTAGLAALAEHLGIPCTIVPVVDGQLQLPCPEHGEECSAWPECTS